MNIKYKWNIWKNKFKKFSCKVKLKKIKNEWVKLLEFDKLFI